MSNVCEVHHPLIAHHLTILRDQATRPALFRDCVRRLSTLLAVSATGDLSLNDRSVTTPIQPTGGSALAQRIGIVPILRAGLGMVDPLLDLLPDAEIWHLGMYRDEATAQPVEYYSKLPPGNPCDVGFVIDPMLATGGSILSAIEALHRWGCQDVRVLSLIAARPGIERLQSAFPQVKLFVAAIDPELNTDNFIVPGLGDAGDRIFNT
ncbi:uracil phosphoribosyltransferase [Aureliella helgolandensis]|uniref:uracil phosphoribosyltransferase n=1 Tax=Aureliella helgolandensis TaxID=2527968 RepID=UPI00119E3DB6|nr:uracil phosphoribosyltransferase [Aureliella helgolandensis]